MIARFRETILTMKSVSSSEIYKHFEFLSKLPLYLSLGNLDFPGSHIIPEITLLGFCVLAEREAVINEHFEECL